MWIENPCGDRLAENLTHHGKVPNIKCNNMKKMQGCNVCECGHVHWHID
jgi:hypothetical protein